MIALIQRLIDLGYGYAANGDVYFDVRTLPSYGRLSGRKLDDMREPAGDSDVETYKRDPRDFTMWKARKPDEPYWDTPWGPGRPGWHLECSAMSHRYRGDTFDIHGGGIDLIFPHHENEIAQSTAAGWGFARYWMHNAWVTMANEKMSKSLGNTLLVSEMVKQWRPVVLRYYLAGPHYRSMIEYSPEALAEAATAWSRIESFTRRAVELLGADAIGSYSDTVTNAVLASEVVVPDAFAAAMDDDLGVPQALAVVHGTVRDGNSALAAGEKEATARALTEVRAMLSVLGVDPFDPRWTGVAGGGTQRLSEAIDELVAVALEQRQAARARKDYAAADAIRDQLIAAGIVIEDTPSGPRWTLREDG
jgi:cysteinyl-tRNA synthetase